MTLTQALEARQADRRRWLERAERLLHADESVVAAWLWGSEGRGTADALSDFDFFVAVREPSALDDVDDRFGLFGDVLWCREVPFNAPRNGRYFAVGYPAAVAPLPIDWYWQPAADARIGTDSRVLLEKTPIARVPIPTFETFEPMDSRPSPHPEDPDERLAGLLVWFWYMYGPLAKKLARRQDDTVAAEVPLLDGVLAMSCARVAQPHASVRGEPIVALRVLAERMESLHPLLVEAGFAPPETARARQSLDMAEQLRAEGWCV